MESSDHIGTYVPCGRCYNCIQTKRSVWTFRILMELRGSTSGYFVTLTYDNLNIPLDYQLDKRHLQLFLKSLRARILKDYRKDERYCKKSEKSSKWSPKLRYFGCGEYGGKTKRPHYHLILFNLPKNYVKKDPIHRDFYSPIIEKIWKKGKIHVGKVEQGSAHYMTKYHMFPLQDDADYYQTAPFALMSRRPGIGANFVTDEIKDYFISTKNSFVTFENGIKLPLGRFYKDKIHGEDYSRKEAANKLQPIIEKMDTAKRELFESELDFIRFEEEEYRRLTKKAKRLTKKNNKL